MKKISSIILLIFLTVQMFGQIAHYQIAEPQVSAVDTILTYSSFGGYWNIGKRALDFSKVDTMLVISASDTASWNTVNGTSGYLPKFGASGLTESEIYESVTGLIYGGTPTSPVPGAKHNFISDNSTGTAVAFTSYYPSGTPFGQILTRVARGTEASPSALLEGDFLSGFAGRGYGSTGFSSGGRGGVFLRASANWSDAIQSTYLDFQTSETNTQTGKMRITGAGNVGINTTTPQYDLDIKTKDKETYLRLSGSGSSTTGIDNVGVLLLQDDHTGFQAWQTFRNNKNISNNDIVFSIFDGSSFHAYIRYIMGGTLTLANTINVLNTGNVGINTTTPSEKLEVSGNIKGDTAKVDEIIVEGNVTASPATQNEHLPTYGQVKDLVYGAEIKVGDVFGGGYVFYVAPGGAWGLTAADVKFSANWSPSNLTTGATGTAVGTGSDNTTDITTAHGSGTYAAKLCEDHISGIYSDWFLPSNDEMILISNNIIIPQVFTYGLSTSSDHNFWSSTELTSSTARAIFTSLSTPTKYTATANTDKTSRTYYVIPVRMWTIDPDALPTGVEGDMLYNNGTEWATLSAGAEGQKLTISTGVPVWQTLTSTSAGNGLTESGSTISLGTPSSLTSSSTNSLTSTSHTHQIANEAITATMLNNNLISGRTALTSGLLSTDELMVSDGGIVKRMDVSVLEDYMQSNLSFGGGSMVYPGAGIAVSTGSAWGTSKASPTGAIVGTTDTQALTNKSVNGVTLSTAQGTTNFLRGDGTYATPPSDSEWTTGTYGINYQSGNVGIGTGANSSLRLYVINENTAIKGYSTDGYGVEGFSDTSTGVRGYSNGDYGLMGVSSASHAVYGSCTFNNTTNYSGYFVGGLGVNSTKGYSVNEVEVIDENGFTRPKSSTDHAAPNNSIYYSTTAGKLVYKDENGTVNPLY